MPTHVSGDNIRDLLIGIANTLKTKINAIDLTQAQKDAIAIIDKIIKTGDGTKYLSNDGNYKTLPLDQISNLQTQLSTINSTLNITNISEHWDNTGILTMPTSRWGIGCVQYNGKIYCMGGYTSSATNIVEIYNVASNTWSTGAAMPTARYGFGCIQYNGKIYCIGGCNAGFKNTVEIYDIDSNTWSTGANMNFANSEFGCVLYGTKIYCISGGLYNYTLIYDIIANTWSTGANPLTSRYELGAVQYNGKIYCIGGYNSTYINKLEIYDIASNTWSTGTVMPASKRAFGCIEYTGKLYCIGGYNASDLNTVYVYDVASGTWSTDSNVMPNANQYFGCVLYNGKVYCIGGDFNYINILIFPNTSYSITLPATLTNTLAILNTTGDGTKLLTDNGTYQTYVPSGYREMSTDELSLLISDIQTTLQ